MATPLEDLLYNLASNSEMRSRFAANPENVLKDTMLSPEEHDAVISGDAARIAELLPPESGVPQAIVVVWGEDS